MTAQPSLFDAPKRTKLAALASVDSRTHRDRMRMLRLLATAPSSGFTDEELQASLDMSGNHVRPRRGELCEAGWVVADGTTRPTRSGRAAAVWVITEAGRRHLAEVDRLEHGGT